MRFACAPDPGWKTSETTRPGSSSSSSPNTVHFAAVSGAAFQAAGRFSIGPLMSSVLPRPKVNSIGSSPDFSHSAGRCGAGGALWARACRVETDSSRHLFRCDTLSETVLGMSARPRGYPGRHECLRHVTLRARRPVLKRRRDLRRPRQAARYRRLSRSASRLD